MKNLLDIFGEHPNWTNSEPDNIPWKEMDSAADEYVQNLLAVGNRWKNIVAYDIEGYQGYEIKFHFKSDKEKKEYEYQQFLEKLTKRYFLSRVFNSLERFGFNVSEINLSPNDIKEWFSEDDILTYGFDSSTPEQTPVIEANISPTSTDAKIKDSGKKPKSTAGAPKAKPFRDYFIKSEFADYILPTLHELLDGEKGTVRAKYIRAIEGVWIETPGHQSVHNEFNNGKKDNTYEARFIRHSQDYGKQKKRPFSDKELEDVRNLILSKIRQLYAE